MNKKGQEIKFIALIIVLITGAIIGGSVISSQISTFTDAQSFSENIVKAGNSTVEQNTTLTKSSENLDLVLGSLSITGLTAGNNYTIDYTTGIINFNDTANDTYPASYNYFESVYISDNSNRTLMGFVFLFVILGLIFFTGKGFGLL